MKSIKKFNNKKISTNNIRGGAVDDYWRKTAIDQSNTKDERLWTDENVEKESWDGQLYVCEVQQH